MDELLGTIIAVAFVGGCGLIFLCVVGRAGIEADKQRARGHADGKAGRPPMQDDAAYFEGYMRARRELREIE